MNPIKFKRLILLGLVLVFIVGINSIIAGAVEIPLIDIKTNLGPYDGNHKYYINIFNIDDTAKAIINGNLIKTVKCCSEGSGWVEITNYLSKGENTIEFNLENVGGPWRYEFELKQDESNIIWRDGCPGLGISRGCKDNDQTGGLVYRNIITLKSSSIYITKSASPYSLRQFQESTIKVLIENSGTSEVKAIEIMDSIHPSFDLTGGDFPNPKKFDSIRAGESRGLQYIIKSKESGAFTLDLATVTYADSEGNIQEVKSEPVSIKVAPSVTSTDGGNSKSASVNLYGEKTDVVLGENVLLKLSAINIIGNPVMHVQVIIIPPNGWSVTSSEFSKSGAGQYTTIYDLKPEDGVRDIEVQIMPNQIGDNFEVKGRIVFYFGEDLTTKEDHPLSLPIKVRKEAAPQQGQTQAPNSNPSTLGFEAIISICGILLVSFLKKKW